MEKIIAKTSAYFLNKILKMEKIIAKTSAYNFYFCYFKFEIQNNYKQVFIKYLINYLKFHIYTETGSLNKIKWSKDKEGDIQIKYPK